MSFWDGLYRSACAALALLFVVGLAMVFVPRWQEYRDLQRRRAEAEARLQLHEEMLHRLKENQERFHRDPRFVERLAHDLGMARHDEIIFRFRERDDEGDVMPSLSARDPGSPARN
jgi:cell division protein FtsB